MGVLGVSFKVRKDREKGMGKLTVGDVLSWVPVGDAVVLHLYEPSELAVLLNHQIDVCDCEGLLEAVSDRMEKLIYV